MSFVFSYYSHYSLKVFGLNVVDLKMQHFTNTIQRLIFILILHSLDYDTKNKIIKLTKALYIPISADAVIICTSP